MHPGGSPRGPGHPGEELGLWGAQILRVFILDNVRTGRAGRRQLGRSLKQPSLTALFFPPSPTDKLTEEEFIEGTLANKEILRLIQFEPQKVKEKLKEKKP